MLFWSFENFVKICLILTSKICFEKFGKIIDFQKSPHKKCGQNGLREISFFLHFLNSWVPRKGGKVSHSQKYEKKVKITAPYCTVFANEIAPATIFECNFWDFPQRAVFFIYILQIFTICSPIHLLSANN
jgi:hypothetical protein